MLYDVRMLLTAPIEGIISGSRLREHPVREFYIPAHGSFALKNLSPGRYDVRYRDLDNGRLARSEEFVIEERVGFDGASQIKTTVTLDKIQKNQVEIFGLLEAEF